MSNLENNTTKLQSILDTVNALPNKSSDNFIVHAYEVGLGIYNNGESNSVEFTDSFPIGGYTHYATACNIPNTGIKANAIVLSNNDEFLSIQVNASLTRNISVDDACIRVYILYLSWDGTAPSVDTVGSFG